MISHLYNFQIFSSVIIIDLIKLFIKNMTELDVELLLLALKYCGFQMRGEDPVALKGIILEIQAKSAKIDSQKPRVKFMIETISDIKNNKKKDGDALEVRYQPLKRYLKGIAKKKGVISPEPLRVPLNDLLASKEKGRWWLVGSAWVGNTETPVINQDEVIDDEISKLAKQQGMNTEVRRRIFHILMTSEDFADAFERLLKLNLKERQEREIIKVLIHCCGQEKVYNQYYAYLAEKLCSWKHSFKITFQYSLWDFFKTIPEASAQKIKNIARLLGFLLTRESLGLIIFKAVDFHDLPHKSAIFFQVVLTLVLLLEDDVTLIRIFQKISQVEEAREGVLFFLFHFIRQGEGLTPEKVAILKRNYKVAKGALQPKVEVAF